MQPKNTPATRHMTSFILFALAVFLLLALGWVQGSWGVGLVVALVFAIGGLIFYRRGK